MSDTKQHAPAIMSAEEFVREVLPEDWPGPITFEWIVAKVEAYTAAIRKDALEDAADAVRAACSPCGGSGVIETSHADHGCGGDDRECARGCPVEVQVQEECEHCGRPIVAIKALKG